MLGVQHCPLAWPSFKGCVLHPHTWLPGAHLMCKGEDQPKMTKGDDLDPGVVPCGDIQRKQGLGEECCQPGNARHSFASNLLR